MTPCVFLKDCQFLVYRFMIVEFLFSKNAIKTIINLGVKWIKYDIQKDLFRILDGEESYTFLSQQGLQKCLYQSKLFI